MGTGLILHERACPRCRKRALVLLRGSRVEGVQRLPGRDPGSLDRTLARFAGLSPREREELTALARAGYDGGLAPPGGDH